MIFCRIEYGDYEPHIGEGLNIEQAFSNAESSAPFDVTSECSITFWEAKKLNTRTHFNITFTQLP